MVASRRSLQVLLLISVLEEAATFNLSPRLYGKLRVSPRKPIPLKVAWARLASVALFSSQGGAGNTKHAADDNMPPQRGAKDAEGMGDTPLPPRAWISTLVQWMAMPSVYTALIWMVAMHPDAAARILPDPKLRWLLGSGRPNSPEGEVKNKLNDLVARTAADWWKLGRIGAFLEAGKGNKAALLEEAQSILQSPAPLTYEEVTSGVGKAARDLVENGSGLRRLLGALTFVNVLSTLALAGIAFSLLPALGSIIQMIPPPVKEAVVWLALCMLNFLKRFDFLIEGALYLIPLYCFGASRRFPVKGAARSQLASLASVLSIFPYRYSWNKHASSREIFSRDTQCMLSALWGASFLMPMALSTNSKFLGFFTVMALFGGMGFFAGVTPFGWVVGFLGDDAMNRSMFASLVIIGTFFASRVAGVATQTLSVFQTGAAIWGTIAFGLAGLIKSDRLWHGGGFRVTALTYPAILLLLIFLGSSWAYPSLSNTAVTMLVLWLSKNFWAAVGLGPISVLVSSAALYYSTIWIKLNPAFLADLFKI